MDVDLTSGAGMTVALLPEVVLSAWALVLTGVAGWRNQGADNQRRMGQLALVALTSAVLALLWLWAQNARPAGLAVMIALDSFRFAASLVLLLGAVLTVLLSLGYLGRERIWAPEYYILLVLATVGGMFMANGADFVVIFLGLELLSVSVYVLAGFDRRSAAASEAALKYFLLGAFASGFLLYGIALIYGATGTTNLTLVSEQITALGLGTSTMLKAGIALLLVGFAFKVAAVPFHMWAPDVYDGAPTPVTAYMAAAVKAAGFAALLRILVYALGDAVSVWQDAVWWLAAITMVAGNLIALAQRHLKRMLAYSSIGHAGYLLAAVTSGTPLGASAFLFYVLAYTLMTLGAFAVLAAVGREGERDVLIDDLSGLASRRPWLAFAMAVFMLSLLGFPGTAGFIGKWAILSAVIEAGQGSLGVVLVVASVVSAGYYLPVIMAMYMKAPTSESVLKGANVVGAARVVIGAAAILLLLFGVWPNRVLDIAADGGEGIRSPAAYTLGE